MKTWLLSMSCALSLTCEAIDWQPWYGRYLELTPTLSYTLQSYHKVQTKCGHLERRSNDSFYTASIGSSFDAWAIDFETTLANTRHHSFYFDDALLAGRYKWLDDIQGDPVTLTLGASFLIASHVGLTDISNFFHGLYNGEVNIAIGKEMTCFDTWSSRWWALAGIGLAEKGSPWLRFDGVYEWALADLTTLQIFTRTLWGLGGNRLCLCHPFEGYGSIHHQSVDLGLEAAHTFDNDLILGVSYAYRVWARNCPEQVSISSIWLEYPFGL